MDDRDSIKTKVKNALAELAERAPLPDYDEALPVSNLSVNRENLWETFVERFKQVHGLPMEDVASLAAYLQKENLTRGYCDSKLLPVIQEKLGEAFVLSTELDSNRIDDYAFGITRAAGAIAETGTLILEDRSTSSRLGSLAPWVHVAVLRKEDLVARVADAVAKLDDDPYILWVTGPSKTADVEGILIEGVHGPGVQICLLV